MPARLAPRRAWDRTRRSRVMWIAAGIALALHVLVGAALLVHPAAVKTFQTWRFKPAMQHGTAVGSQVVEPLNFVLRQ